MKFIKVCFVIIIGCTQSGFTQNAKKQAINQAIDYVNHCNLYISATHYSVKRYNIKVLDQFKRPDYYHENDDLFELECHPGSIECAKKLDISTITEAYFKIKNHTEIPELKLALKAIDQSFDELSNLISHFENQSFTKSFFLDKSNIEKLETDLLTYKTLVEKLTNQFQEFSKLTILQFNENRLPNPLESDKK